MTRILFLEAGKGRISEIADYARVTGYPVIVMNSMGKYDSLYVEWQQMRITAYTMEELLHADYVGPIIISNYNPRFRAQVELLSRSYPIEIISGQAPCGKCLIDNVEELDLNKIDGLFMTLRKIEDQTPQTTSGVTQTDSSDEIIRKLDVIIGYLKRIDNTLKER